MHFKEESSSNTQAETNASKSSLSIIEIKFKLHREFEPFLVELLEKIDRSIECLVNSPSFSSADPVMIVSHEYLYGYDHCKDNGMTDDELREFESRLQSKIDELAKKYSIDVALSPGTVVLKGEIPSNRAYFFTPKNQVRYTDKSKELYQIFAWNGKKVFISICCNWSHFKYTYNRPKADIYFIPSSGYLFLSQYESEAYAGSAHEVDRKPGIIYINSDEEIGSCSIFRVKDSVIEKKVSFCLEPGHLEHLDKPEAQSSFDGIKIFTVEMNLSPLEEKKMNQQMVPEKPFNPRFHDNSKQFISPITPNRKGSDFDFDHPSIGMVVLAACIPVIGWSYLLYVLFNAIVEAYSENDVISSQLTETPRA